jgi:hypothetical protein
MPIYIGATVSLLFFMAIAWITANFLNLEGPMFAAFFGIMSTLGITAAAFFVWSKQNTSSARRLKEKLRRPEEGLPHLPPRAAVKWKQ